MVLDIGSGSHTRQDVEFWSVKGKDCGLAGAVYCQKKPTQIKEKI